MFRVPYVGQCQNRRRGTEPRYGRPTPPYRSRRMPHTEPPSITMRARLVVGPAAKRSGPQWHHQVLRSRLL